MINENLYSISAERSVLGSIMLDPKTYENVSEIVSSADFFRPEHILIYDAILSVVDSLEALDLVTISERLDRDGKLEEVGGIPYLLEIADSTPSASNVVSYAEIVRERSVIRRLAYTASEIAGMAHNREGKTSAEIVDSAETMLARINDTNRTKGTFKKITDVLNMAVDKIDERSQSKGGVTGVSTGIEDLDELTLGLQNTDLVIIGGRPSSGKTSLAMNIAESVAIDSKGVVAVFSLEMPADHLATRMLSSVGRVNQKKLKKGDLDPADWAKVITAAGLLKSTRLSIYDTPAISPVEMRNQLRKLEREQGNIDLVIVDYLQLMRIEGFKEGRANEVSEISKSLKSMAKEFNCPMIALSQLNRGLESRQDKRPINSDLRESGAIEQDADLIALIYRDEVYNPDSPDKGIAEIIIGKHRNGELGTVRAAFIGQYTRFENLSPESYRDSQNY